MKIEQVEKGIKRGISGIGGFIKQNPLIVLGILALLFLVVLFTRPERRAEEVIIKPKPEPKPERLQVDIPPVQPYNVMPDIGFLFEDIIKRQELFAAEIAGIHDALRVDRVEAVEPAPEPVVEVVERIIERVVEPANGRRDDNGRNNVIRFDPQIIDFYADPQRYKREIMRKDVIRPPRPRRRDKILTAEGRWERIEDVERRQRDRYERALAAGQKDWGELVRRETEIALGHRVRW